MKTLQEIARLLERKQLKKIEILDAPSSSTYYSLLFKGIKSGNYATDEIAARDIYNTRRMHQSLDYKTPVEIYFMNLLTAMHKEKSNKKEIL